MSHLLNNKNKEQSAEHITGKLFSFELSRWDSDPQLNRQLQTVLAVEHETICLLDSEGTTGSHSSMPLIRTQLQPIDKPINARHI